MIGPRHTTALADPKASALQHSENARDTLQALTTKLTAHWALVERYTAAGDPMAKIAVGIGALPVAVVLVNVTPVHTKIGQVAPRVTGSLGFLWDAPTQTISVYEPAGLIAGDVYALTYLVGERS
jgi:hypothetical protein